MEASAKEARSEMGTALNKESAEAMDSALEKWRRAGKSDEKIKEYWQRIVIAYTYNQLKELEQLDVMVMAYLQSEGLEAVDLELDDLDDRVAETEEEIKNIISTNPYLYKQLLQDEAQTLQRKQEYQDEIASYEIYSAQLDEVLATFDIERKLS